MSSHCTSALLGPGRPPSTERAMHRALRIPEIVRAIAGELSQPGPEAAGYNPAQSLAALARACRAFSEPALDLLWERPALWNLATLMQEELWTVVETEYEREDFDEDEPALGVRRTLKLLPHYATTVPDQIDLGGRFAYYAKRVRSLILDEYVEHTPSVRLSVAPDVLAIWAARSALLPRLRSLKVCAGYLAVSPAHEALLSAFLRPARLQTLNLRIFHEPVDVFERHRTALVASCAGVQRLSIVDHSYGWAMRAGPAGVHGRWAALVGEMLARAATLQRLEICVPLRYADLVLLGTLPSLGQLRVSHIVDVPALPASLSMDAFPALRSLTLDDHTPDARLTQNVFSFRPRSSLVKCSSHIHSVISTDNVCAVLSAITGHASLQSASVHLLTLTHPFPTLRETSAILRALRPSSTLEVLSMHSAAELPLDLVHLMSVLALYPRLTHFAWRVPSHMRSCELSLGTLMEILRPRPHVRALPVVIDSASVPSAEDRSDFGTHAYDALLEVARAACTVKLRSALAELFPYSSHAARA